MNLTTEATAGRPGIGVYVGLFLITMSTLTYEILLTRIFSVTMWYHFAFVAVSVALFGLTAGALLVHLRPDTFPLEATKVRIAQATLLFSVSIVASFVTQLAIPFDGTWSIVGVYSTTLIYLIISVPFVFSGIAVSLVLTRFPGQVSRLYAADLVGAGLGALAVIWLFVITEDGPSAVLVVAAFVALAAAAFASDAALPRIQRYSLALLLILIVLAAGNAYAAHNNNAYLRITWAKGEREVASIHESWNAFSRIQVSADPVPSAPFAWGRLSPTYQVTSAPRELLLTIDASAGTVLTQFDGDTSKLEYLKFDVTNLVHYLRPNADVLVIGSGGGRDVLTALVFEQESVTAIELNDDILDTVNGRFGDFTGHLDRQDGVKFISAEARSYLAGSDESYDIMQFSLIDTWAATSAGAFALAENALYTVEAWELFLEHLEPDGVLSVSRWYVQNRPVSAYRLVSLAAAALREIGVENPTQHIMFARSTGGSFFPDVGTIFVSKEPFSKADIDAMDQVTTDLQFELVLAPRAGLSDETFANIAMARDPTAVDIGGPGDISAPTDDRPFFFQQLRYQDLFNRSLYTGRTSEFLLRPVLVLFSLAIAVIMLTVLVLLLPVMITTTREAMRGLVPLVVFFAGIGLGFIFIELSQMQRLVMFLGQPTFALSVVLFTLLTFGGLGSLATDRLVKPRLTPALLLPLSALLAILVVFGLSTPAIVDKFEASGTFTRILVAGGILAPVGLFMGMPFPLGLKVASLRPDAPTAFLWGVNGATSVAGSVLAIAVALAWGISTSFWVGSASYVIATVGLGIMVFRGRV